MIGKSIAWFFCNSRDLIARGLIRLGVTPNMITLTGCVLTMLTGFCLAMGVASGERFFYAFAVLLLYWCAACDMLDGAVARLGGKGTEFGRFLDSTTDRVSDFSLWAGLAMGFAASTPAVDAQRVYVTWISGAKHVIVALDHNGTKVWQRQISDFKARHGAGASPIVIDKTVIVSNDHEGTKSFLAGLDAETGQTRWKIDRTSGATS